MRPPDQNADDAGAGPTAAGESAERIRRGARDIDEVRRSQPGDEPHLQHLLDDAVRRRDSGRRASLRWLRQQAEDETSFAEILSSLADRGEQVVLTLSSGARHAGFLQLVGRDVAALYTDAFPLVVARIPAITMIRAASDGRHRPHSDGRTRRHYTRDVFFREILAALAPERPDVLVYVSGAGDAAIHGRLMAVGDDVVTLRPPGMGEVAVHIPQRTLAALALAPA